MRALLIFVLIAGTASPAAARPMSRAARAAHDRAVELYDAGRYDAAVAEFQAGYAKYRHPDFLYGLGQAERKRGDCKAAVAAYEAFLKETPEDSVAAQKARLNMSRCEPPPVPAPAPDPAPAPAPVERQESVSMPKEPGTGTGTGTGTGAIPEPEDGSVAWYRDGWGMSFAVSSIALAVTGTALVIVARRSVDSVDQAPSLDDRQSKIDRAELLRNVGVGSLIGSGVLLGAAVYRYAARDSRRGVSVSAGPSSAMVVWEGRF